MKLPDGRDRRTAQPAADRAEFSLAGGGGDVDRASIIRWADRFGLLADPNRLALLVTIHATPGACVSDLARAVGMSDTSVSQALRLLRTQGWITKQRSGRLALYSLDDETVHALLHMLGAPHLTPAGRR
ncbi:MAG: ArsR/SmtB family transcription factor [Jiangellaceae bacterium]